jgi:hypothetical protein
VGKESRGTMVLIQAVEGVLTLIFMGLVGYVLAYKKWFTPETTAIIPKLVNYVSLPLFLLYSLVHAFHRDELIHLVYGALVPLISMIICFGLSLFLGRLLHINKKHIGIFHAAFTTSNSIFIGLPVTLALFGEKAIPYTLLYFFANTTFFWTIGNYALSGDSGQAKVKLFSRSTLKRIFSGPIIGFLTAVILILLNIQLPDFILNAVQYLGNMTTPLALILIGITLYGMNLKKIRLNRDLLWVLLGRFVISPLSIMAVAYFIPIPVLMYKVFVIMASLPAMIQIVVLSSFYKTDTEYATVVVSASTLLSIVTIPIFMLLLS